MSDCAKYFRMAGGGGSQDRNDSEGVGFTFKENNCQANVRQADLMTKFNPNVIGQVGQIFTLSTENFKSAVLSDFART